MKEQKAQLIHTITEGMIEVYGEGMRDKRWVVIEEVQSENWAIGGNVPTVQPRWSFLR